MYAKEMFEMLGYTKMADSDFIIIYMDCCYSIIGFIKEPKRFFIDNRKGFSFIMSYPLVQAISKQLEELGCE